MAGQIDRRDFLRSLGVGAGVTLGAAAGSIPLIGMAQACDAGAVRRIARDARGF